MFLNNQHTQDQVLAPYLIPVTLRDLIFKIKYFSNHVRDDVLSQDLSRFLLGRYCKPWVDNNDIDYIFYDCQEQFSSRFREAGFYDAFPDQMFLSSWDGFDHSKLGLFPFVFIYNEVLFGSNIKFTNADLAVIYLDSNKALRCRKQFISKLQKFGLVFHGSKKLMPLFDWD